MEINTEEYRKYKPDKDDKEAESCEDRGAGHDNKISKMFCGRGEENNLKKSNFVKVACRQEFSKSTWKLILTRIKLMISES